MKRDHRARETSNPWFRFKFIEESSSKLIAAFQKDVSNTYAKEKLSPKPQGTTPGRDFFILPKTPIGKSSATES